ncbi:MAG: hypothetical protein WC714_29275, partial [Candidatus Obscuribacterales bacterium]
NPRAQGYLEGEEDRRMGRAFNHNQETFEMIPDPQIAILEQFKPVTSERFYCSACQRDRSVKDRVFKEKFVNGRNQRLARCKFCK